MRRRAALYLLLGLVTALLVVGMATALQSGNSTDPHVWLWVHHHVPLLQMLDLSAAFLFVVIGTYGLTVSRLQLQLRHQAEDFGDQMQSLVHRNDELAKVNEEYAEQIASLEAVNSEPPALTMGDSSQRVVAALHWQVDAQARQLEAVHKTLEHQHDILEDLRQHVHALEGQEHAAPSLPPTTAASPLLPDSSPLLTVPEPEREMEPAHEVETQAEAEATKLEREEDTSEAVLIPEQVGLAEGTGNDGSTQIGEMLEFDVSAFASPEPPPPTPRPKSTFARAGKRESARSYPVDDSYLAMTAGHLSSIPESAAPSEESAPSEEPERIEISVGKNASTPPSSEPFVEFEEAPPARTEGALALDMAESALSSLKSETQEALSSLRAQVEATIPQANPLPPSEPEKSSQNSRRKPWHLRF